MAPKKKSKKKDSKSGTDSKYFSTNKKGELVELKNQLSQNDRAAKVEGVKKVIAAMTVGKDVSSLFPSVVQCMQTENLELKKLVYLYLMNYAKTNPDLAILVVNTFVKDAVENQNPLIRALAIRTMGCIRVDRIVEYLCEPLRACIADTDPYVRKTAAVCVAKLYDVNPEMAAEQGFLQSLVGLLSDSNPAVVANAVAALAEIDESTGGNGDVFKVKGPVLQKLLAALNECSEWGQVFILDSLSKYGPRDANDAESIIERVTPRLQHANAAVVMSAVKLVMCYFDILEDDEMKKQLLVKMAPPLVTLLSSESEIQYVALRNINLVVQKQPAVLTKEIKVFFCKYNDPIYCKLEKLEIMIKLTSERNVEQVLMELKEYASEVDVAFVRKSVRAIGRCAIKLERAAERCINVLLELIRSGVNYVVQEAICVIKDIFRKYPNRYESIIATLCENLDTLDEPEAKASMIWIIGEYADRIDNADELLDTFLEAFHDESHEVQLQLLTATVKLYLKRPADTKDMMENVLSMATEDSDDPDLRDRGYVYWRLLSTDPEAAKAVVLGEKPAITDDSEQLEPSLLEDLIGHMSSIASVYHKPPSSFVQRKNVAAVVVGSGDENKEDDDSVGSVSGSGSEDDYQSESEDDEDEKPAATQAPAAAIDLLGMDLLSMDSPAPSASTPQLPQLLAADAGHGLQVNGQLARVNGTTVLQIQIVNVSSTAPAQTLALQCNKNTLALGPVSAAFQLDTPAAPGGGSGSASVPLIAVPKLAKTDAPAPFVEVALKDMATGNVLYFRVPLPLEAALVEDGRMEQGSFVQQWKSIPTSNEVFTTVQLGSVNGVQGATSRLQTKNILFVAKRTQGTDEMAYYSMKTITGVDVMLELTFRAGVSACRVCIRTNGMALAPFAQKAVQQALTA